MFLALCNRRIFAGLIVAMPLVALGPLVAVAQYGYARTMPNGYPSAAVAAGYRTADVALPKRDSLLGDQGLQWKLPFTRKKPAPTAGMPPRQPLVGRTVPRTVLQQSAGPQQPQIANQPPRTVAGNTNRLNMPLGHPGAQFQGVPHQYQSRPAAGPTAQAAAGQQRMAQRPTAAPRQRPLPTAVLAQPAQAARPAGSAPQSRPQTRPASPPSSPAMQMLAQANAWSQSAETNTDYTRIIDTCRQASAGNSAPEIERYAKQLSAWALNRRGQLEAEAGNEEQAVSDFDAAIEADPLRWRAIHNRGVLLAGNGEFEKAFEDFTRTIELNPRFAKAYSNRAALFVVAGKIPSAIEDYARAVELDPELTVAHRGLGRACHLDGQLDTAIRHYDEAVRLAPNDAYAIASRADVLTDLGHYAEGAADYDLAIEVDPKSSTAYCGSAWLLATCPEDSIRNPKLALERAQAAIELTEGKDAACLDTLAAAQASHGDYAGAVQSMQQAIELASPGERESYLERLALYEQQQPYRLEQGGSVVQTSHEGQ